MAYSADGKTLAATGAASVLGMTGSEVAFWAAAAIVTGGVLVGAARMGPRLAFEPRYDFKRDKERMMLTYNGHPIKRHRR